MMKSARRSSSSPKKPSDKGPATWQWDKMYDVLDRLSKEMRSPDDTMESIQIAIDSARQVETKAVVIYAKISRFLAQARKNVTDAKFRFRLQFQKILTDKAAKQNYRALTKQQWSWIAESALTEEQRQVDESVDILTRITVFMDCVDRILANAKHLREDISKKIRIKEVEKGII